MADMVQGMSKLNMSGLNKEQADEVAEQYHDFMDSVADDHLMQEEG
jgi:phage/plasmid-associated DNA primase